MDAALGAQQSVLLHLRGLLPSLKQQEQKVGNFVLEHPYEVVKLSITELSEKCRVSDATIFRFCRKMGLEGYGDFKIALARDLASPHSLTYTDITPQDSLGVIAEKVIAASIKALRDTQQVLDTEALDRAIEAILAAPRVEVYAIGGAGIVARELQFKLMQVGVNINAFLDAEMQLIRASLLTERDVGIGVSHSGESKHTNEALRLVKAAGGTTIGITNHPHSSLAQVVDIKLCTSAREIVAPADSPGVRTAQLAIVDALYEGIIVRQHDRSQSNLTKVARAISNLHF